MAIAISACRPSIPVRMAGNRCGCPSSSIVRPRMNPASSARAARELEGRVVRYTTQILFGPACRKASVMVANEFASQRPGGNARREAEAPIDQIDGRHEFDERRHRRGAGEARPRTGRAQAPVKARIREIASLLLIERIRKRIGADGGSADAPHVLHRQSRYRQDHGRACGWPDILSRAGLRAARPSGRR